MKQKGDASQFTRWNQKKFEERKPNWHNYELINCLKNCIQQTIKLFQICDAIPKKLQNCRNVLQYSKKLENLLTDAIQIISNNLVKPQIYEKIIKQNENLIKENEKFRGNIFQLQNKIRQFEQRQKKLIKQNNRQKQLCKEKDNKIKQIQKDSQQSVLKIIQTSKQKQRKMHKQSSLPIINSHTNKQKIALLMLMGTPQKKHNRHQSLLIKNYENIQIRNYKI